MNSLRPDIIHIGYPKAASTFLQREVFSRLDGQVSFVNKAATRFEDGVFTLRQPGVIKKARHGNLPILVSQEAIAAETLRDRVEAAEQLHQLNPQARIVICVRSQFSIMRGAYILALKGDYSGSYRSYLKAVGGQKYRYDVMVGRYWDLFKPKRVKIVFQEDLKTDCDGTLRSLLEFMGISDMRFDGLAKTVRPTPSDLLIDARRPANFIAKRLGLGKAQRDKFQYYARLPAAVLEIKIWKPITGREINYRDYAAYKDFLRNTYGESNRRFFEMLGLETKGYDYPL